MKRVSLILFLVVLVLGSAYASAEGIEVGADLQFSSFVSWNENTYSVTLPNIAVNYDLSPALGLFGSFQFGNAEEAFDISKLKVGAEYTIPFSSFDLGLRGGLATYKATIIGMDYNVNTSALLFGGKAVAHITYIQSCPLRADGLITFCKGNRRIYILECGLWRL